MVPLRLRLQNFLCYRDNCPPLDFSGIGMACLSGENGHGKSALLDAITWALWGEARARTDDELIHVGCVDMEVEFEFRVGDVRYRALRKRRRGTQNSPGRVILEFQVLSGEAWKALSGTNVRETQARITAAVRLDYETFRNSAFLMQGRADEFTVKAPNDRKRVLAEILGLSAYDGYEARAKEERARWHAEANRLEAQAVQLARELANEPEYQRQLTETRTELTALETELADRRALVNTLRESERAIGLLRSQREAVDRDRDAARARVDGARADAVAQTATIARLQAILDRTDEIRSQFATLRSAREQESEQSRRLRIVSVLRDEEQAVTRLIDREAHALETQIIALDAETTRLRGVLERSGGLGERRAAASVERAALTTLDLSLTRSRGELDEHSRLAGQLDAENKRLRADMDEMKAKIDGLASGGAACPICGTALGEEGKRRIVTEYRAAGSEMAAVFKQKRAARTAAEARASELKGEIDRSEADLRRRRQAVERAAADLDQIEREMDGARAALPGKETELQSVRALSAGSAFAPEARAMLADLQRRFAAANYDRPAHERAGVEIKRLAGAEDEHARLQRAEEAMSAAIEARQKAERDLGEWGDAFARTDTLAQQLDKQLAAHSDPHDQLVRLTDQIEQLEQNERRLRQALGAAEQRLDDCRRYRRQQAANETELTAARMKQQIYEDLTVAFGKRGVQALIIDAVLPEIEEEANRLLARMTNGRMAVALTTQRLTRQGTVSETLDVTISDELGTRAYEMFSGGEAFRINLALRIALSRLLARRAGAPLPTLVVDEGFGTQDAAGRERLIEALNAVAQDFQCLIVITHIDELRDQFDQQILVEKTPQGSIARVI